MIKLEAKEDVKNAKNCFMYLKLENFVLIVLELSQKNKQFCNLYHHIITF